MRSRLIILFLALLLLISSVFFSPTSKTRAQSESQEKPNLKDFGSSLKRLKWDPEKQAATDIQQRASPARDTSEDDVIRVDTDLVTIEVQVRDGQGRIVPDLTKDDFIITDSGRIQEIAHFSRGNDLAVQRSIVLVIDYSGSQARYLHNSVEAGKNLIKQLGPMDSMAIVTDDVELLVPFTRDKAKLKKALESLENKARSGRSFGRSFQFSALLAAVRELFSVEDVRPIVIFQTDGDELGLLQPPDPRYFFKPLLPEKLPKELKEKAEKLIQKSDQHVESLYRQFSLVDIEREIEKSRATVYTVIPGRKLIGLSAYERTIARKSELTGQRPELDLRIGYSEQQFELIANLTWRAQLAASEVATISGGWASFLESPDQTENIYSAILADINSRWLIGYYPIDKVHDGKRHNVLVEVRNHPDYVVTGRKSYYATEVRQQ
jgi:VWFA-related protein